LQHGRLEARETGGEKMFERAPAGFERGRKGPRRFGRLSWRGRVHDIFLDFEPSFNKAARRAQPFSPPKVNAAGVRRGFVVAATGRPWSDAREAAASPNHLPRSRLPILRAIRLLFLASLIASAVPARAAGEMNFDIFRRMREAG
jgi:hypothetical protein